jgi:excinuclease ABC subunit C
LDSLINESLLEGVKANASFYNIRDYFQKRSKKRKQHKCGRKYNELIARLKQKDNNFGKETEPKTHKYRFLKNHKCSTWNICQKKHKQKNVPRGTKQKMDIKENLNEQIKMLPESPGVYQYFNSKGEIIYVGKAKNLKRRIATYFTKKHESNKTNVLVKNIALLKYIVVGTESDALLLENNLIKEFQPRYNILLKDDKTYPSICITKEEFPRVFKTRNIIKNGSEYYGPYSSVNAMNYLLDTIHKIFPFRTCKFPLTTEGVSKKKYKICLKYHIHLCNGACEGYETREEYNANINRIREIIKGNANEISKLLLKEIGDYSDKLNFEKAYLLKQKYDLLQNFVSKTVIANTIIENTDVFGFDETENSAYISILRIAKGAIVQGFTIEYKKQIDETRADLLSLAILELREKLNSNSKEIIVPFEIEYPIPNVKINIPHRGDRKKLLELAEQNVRQYKLEHLKRTEKLNPDQRGMQLMKEVQEKLHLEKLPIKIEIFDNSNIQGSSAVAACVVYKKGKPSKKDYRKYNIKTVEGQDDYASMREIVSRRYTRVVREKDDLPDLIVADGGIGQMEAIRQIVEDELHLKIPIAGLAKNEKHRTNEILVGFPPAIIGLKPTDRLFKFFATMQDEVHRFAIKFHREKRSKSQVHSELDEIKGIGKNTKNSLLLHYKSVKRIQNAEISDLEKIIGKSRASIIYNHFRNNLST